MLKKPGWRRPLAIGVLAGVAGWLGSSALVAWRFTRRVCAVRSETLPPVAWPVESHRLQTARRPADWGLAGSRRSGKACVLLVHGQGGSRSAVLPTMRWLADARFTVLAITVRAHGDSSGDANDFGWSARRDVAAAVEFLKRECPGRPIYVVGRSLGAAAAIFVARELGGSVKGYSLEQPYKDLKTATWNRLRHYLPPVLDWTAYAGLLVWAPVFLSVDPEEISPYNHIRDIPQGAAVVFAVGSADRHAPLNDVRAMCERIESHARLVVFDGAAHVDLEQANPQLYRSTLLSLLGEALPAREAPRAAAGRGLFHNRRESVECLGGWFVPLGGGGASEFSPSSVRPGRKQGP